MGKREFCLWAKKLNKMEKEEEEQRPLGEGKRVFKGMGRGLYSSSRLTNLLQSPNVAPYMDSTNKIFNTLFPV